MRDDAKHNLAVEREGPPVAQGGTQVPFEHRKRRLDLPALPVGLFREAPVKLTAILAPHGLRPVVVAPSSAMRGGEDALDAQLVPAQRVGLFALVPGIPQERREGVAFERLPDQHGKLDDVALGAAVHDGPGHEVALDVADGRELRETPLIVPLVPPTGPGVMHRHVPRLHPGGVDGGGRTVVADYLELAGEVNGRIQEAVRAPFFSRRSSA